MGFDTLDADELLHLGLEAMNTGRDADALVALKTLVERDPRHAMGRYLLAAQHAQMGLMDRAEAGFRDVVAAAPDFPMARFQLGQLLLARGDAAAATAMFAPLCGGQDAVGHYARGLAALGAEDAAAARDELEAGLALPQEIPALAGDMRRLLESLQPSVEAVEAVGTDAAIAPIFLTGYGQATSRAD